MPTLEDLSPLKEKRFSDALDKFEKLMTQNGIAFLLGAGCGKCADLPLTSQLTEEVLGSDDLDSDSKAILAAIKENFKGDGHANIEDYLSELVDYLAIAERRNVLRAENKTINPSTKECDSDMLTKAAEQIKRSIVKVINKPRITNETHRGFVKAVHKPLRPGTLNNQSVDYLVLNYDTLIENSLAMEKIPYADGINGGVIGWWDPSTFNQNGLSARVLKLHGSIDWMELESETLPRRVPSSISEDEIKNRRTMIWPASTKYRETQRDPYAQLIKLASQILHPSQDSHKLLVICGYSFGDSHINIELARALHESNGRLTLAIFYTNDEINGCVKEWYNNVAIRDQVLIFGKRGFWHGDTIEVSTNDLPWWKFENLTRLIGGDR
jgi:hypothetical protein